MSDTAFARLQQASECHDNRLEKVEAAQEASAEKIAIVPGLNETVKDHEIRIRGLEKANFKLAAQASAITGGIVFLLSLGAQLLIKFVH